MSIWAILADAIPPEQAQPQKRDPFESAELIWGMIALMAALLVGAAAVYFADKWRKNALKPDDGTGALSSYREMYDAGEITAEEYAELKRRAAGQMRAREPGAPVQPVPPAAPPPNPPARAPDQPPPPR